MALVLDTGALIALERNDRATWLRVKHALRVDEAILTHGGVVGHAWRGGARQALLARALEATEVRPLDESLGRQAGALLATAHRSDVIDAAVVLLAEDGDWILTSDPDDIAPLAAARGQHVELIPV
jgi:hypothetical protein